MKVWKIISGILSCVLFCVVVFQSCAAGISNTLQSNGASSGSAGVFLAIFMLAGGIIGLVTREKNPKGANIAMIALFGIGAILGFVNCATFPDLAVWGVWCAINAVTSIISLFIKPKQIEE